MAEKPECSTAFTMAEMWSKASNLSPRSSRTHSGRTAGTSSVQSPRFHSSRRARRPSPLTGIVQTNSAGNVDSRVRIEQAPGLGQWLVGHPRAKVEVPSQKPVAEEQRLLLIKEPQPFI